MRGFWERPVLIDNERMVAMREFVETDERPKT